MFHLQRGLKVAIIHSLAVLLLASTGFAQDKRVTKQQKQMKHSSVEPPSIAAIDDELHRTNVQVPGADVLSLPAFGLLPGKDGNAGMASDPAPSDVAGNSGAQKLSKSFAAQNAKDLLQKIGLNENVSIKFENQPHSPIIITDAKIKVVKKIKDNHTDNIDLQDDEYRIEASIRLANAGEKQIMAFGVYFTNTGERPNYDPLLLSTHLDAYGYYTFQKIHEDEWSYWLKDPEQIVVKIAGIVFHDNSIWEEQPESKAIRARLFNRTSEGITQIVDQRPVPLTHPHPEITEEMRKTDTRGSVCMRVLIGTDGTVKQVRILSGLPDGFNEAAIATAKKMRFQPAIKDAQPIVYWLNMDIGFNIR
jgi:TonB family protein